MELLRIIFSFSHRQYCAGMLLAIGLVLMHCDADSLLWLLISKVVGLGCILGGAAAAKKHYEQD